PMRDDPELGLEIRYVYPKGPADVAGLKAGDRISKVGTGNNPLQAFQGREGLANALSTLTPGSELKMEVVRKEGKKTETVTVKRAEFPDLVAEKLPEEASLKKALEPKKTVGPPMPMPKPEEKKEDDKKEKEKPETGFFERKDTTGTRTNYYYVPGNYDANIA